MTRTLIPIVLVALASAAVAQGFFIRRPAAPAAPAPPVVPACKVNIFNNTPDEIVFVLSSAHGTVRSRLAPGWAHRVPFCPDGKVRVLTTFSCRTGDLVSSRLVQVIDGNYYDALPVPPATPLPVPNPLPPPTPLPGGDPGVRAEPPTDKIQE